MTLYYKRLSYFDEHIALSSSITLLTTERISRMAAQMSGTDNAPFLPPIPSAATPANADNQAPARIAPRGGVRRLSVICYDPLSMPGTPGQGAGIEVKGKKDRRPDEKTHTSRRFSLSSSRLGMVKVPEPRIGRPKESPPSSGDEDEGYLWSDNGSDAGSSQERRTYNSTVHQDWSQRE